MSNDSSVLGIQMITFYHNFLCSCETDEESEFSTMKRIKLEPEGILSPDDDIIAQLQQETSDLEVEPVFALESIISGDDNFEGVLKQHMDIREPLSTLRNLLEQKLGIELLDYTFWLQDTQMVRNSEFDNSISHLIFIYYKKEYIIFLYKLIF